MAANLLNTNDFTFSEFMTLVEPELINLAINPTSTNSSDITSVYVQPTPWAAPRPPTSAEQHPGTDFSLQLQHLQQAMHKQHTKQVQDLETKFEEKLLSTVAALTASVQKAFLQGTQPVPWSSILQQTASTITDFLDNADAPSYTSQASSHSRAKTIPPQVVRKHRTLSSNCSLPPDLCA